MSFLDALYPPITKESKVPTLVFKPRVDKTKEPEITKVVEKPKVAVVKQETPVVAAPAPAPAPAPVVETGPKKKGPKKPRFTKGSEEAKEWSKEMAIRKRLNREKKMVEPKSE